MIKRSNLILTLTMAFLAIVFLFLGSWQVQRLFWKLDLIARVDARVNAAAIQAPAAATPDDEYRHITTAGTFLNDQETLVQAVTELGAGFWVVTPLLEADGRTILVNRGFVPTERKDKTTRAEGDIAGSTQVTGLLRLTEPGGAFLRSNDPAGNRWYSRDVTAIASAKGLNNVAPYFIDADKTPNAGGYPVGGLTVVTFPNSHLSYALTWFALAAMSIGAAIYVRRSKA